MTCPSDLHPRTFIVPLSCSPLITFAWRPGLEQNMTGLTGPTLNGTNKLETLSISNVIARGGGGGGKWGVGTNNIFGWGCAARSWKPLPYFRPKYTIFHTLFQTLWVAVISATLNRIYGVRDFVTPQTKFVFFSSRYNVCGNTLLLKMVSQTKQIEHTTYFRPKWQNLYPISD